VTIASAASANSPLRRLLVRAARAAFRAFPPGRRTLWSLPPATRAVALTFDDGPDPVWTPRVLDLLASHGATASFFLLGWQANAYPELVERIQAEGHSLGSHTALHENLRRLPFRRALAEIRAGAAAVRAVTGVEPRWFRPPYGAFSAASLWWGARAGVSHVLWNLDPHDYEAESGMEILARLGPLQPGQIVLLHDRFAATVDALPEILARVGDAELRALSLDAALAELPRHGARGKGE
jgi:peptidoglycan/xylan/chitin deacetylase (PgdA/CDA1 family)